MEWDYGIKPLSEKNQSTSYLSFERSPTRSNFKFTELHQRFTKNPKLIPSPEGSYPVILYGKMKEIIHGNELVWIIS